MKLPSWRALLAAFRTLPPPHHIPVPEMTSDKEIARRACCRVSGCCCNYVTAEEIEARIKALSL